MSGEVEILRERFPEAVVESHAHRGDVTVVVRPEAWREVATFLLEDRDHGFELLMDVTAVDYLRRKPRFEVVYHFLSHRRRARLRVKLPVEGKGPVVPSIHDLWPSADWYEREVWDMFGIRFEGHPDLRRILMYDEFVGHPLRKDYRVDKRQPLVGPVN